MNHYVSRSDLHNNFLKSIIIRLDFRGISEQELEGITDNLKPYFKKNGFDRIEKKEWNDSNHQPKPMYCFTNEIKGYQINVSNIFIVLCVNSCTYHPFEEYSGMFNEIITLAFEHFDFFMPKRFGIRKTNICILDDIRLIPEYFAPEQIGFYNVIPNANNIKNTSIDNFTIESYMVNYTRELFQGTLEEKTVYKICVDIDVYSDDDNKVKEILEDVNKQLYMNEIIFSIFTNSLSSKMLSALSDEDFQLNGILGVEENE